MKHPNCTECDKPLFDQEKSPVDSGLCDECYLLHSEY